MSWNTNRTMSHDLSNHFHLGRGGVLCLGIINKEFDIAVKFRVQFRRIKKG